MAPTKATSAAVGVLMGLTALVTAPGIAVAVNGCDYNRVCLFDDNNFVNRIGNRPAGEPRENLGSDKNDRTDSWDNNTRTDAAWYYNFTWENADNCRNMPALREDANLGVFNSDEASSWRTNRGC